MGKNGNGGSRHSFAELSACIAVVVAIIAITVQIICNYVNVDILNQINAILMIIKNVCLTLAVIICAVSYAQSMKQNGTKTFVYVCIAIYAVLFILGYVL